jgi:cytochrome P450
MFEVDLAHIAYEDADSPEEAHRRIRQARHYGPIAMGPHGPEILSYRLVRSVLRDSRFCMPKGLLLASQGIMSGPLWDKATTTLLSLHGAEHNRLRGLVSRAFVPGAIARLDAVITGVITKLVDPLTAVGRCDVVADIARPYPIPVIGALLGVPAPDWRVFSDWADDISKMFTWAAVGNEARIIKAYDQLDAYVDEMVAARRQNLTDDLISELIRAEEDGDRLSADELRRIVAVLLNGGTDTTRNQLAAAVQVLCDHPEQWAMLADHPELAPNAVEELIRHTPVLISTTRQTIEDVEVAGVAIPAGAHVMLNIAAANRDPEMFAEPERLDITREVPPAVLTFGGGIHYCLGVHLARAELIQALTVITQRMHNPRRTGPAPWKPFIGIAGPAALPIEFDINPARAR